MRYAKILGLAAVAVTALLACVGVGTASATVLCKTTPTGGTCPENQAWPAGTTIHMVNTGTVFVHTPFRTIECKKSTIQSPTENEGSGSDTVKGAVEVLTFEECNCEVKVLTKGLVELHSLANHNGTVTLTNIEFTATCATIFGNVHCIYALTNRDIGDITAGNPAVLHVEVTLESTPTNMLCNEERTWTGTYEITSPKPLFFASST